MLDVLRQRLQALQKVTGIDRDPGSLPLGIAAVDAALGGGLARGALHEIAAPGEAHLAAATGFALGLASLPALRVSLSSPLPLAGEVDRCRSRMFPTSATLKCRTRVNPSSDGRSGGGLLMGIMHLTYHDPDTHTGAASTANAGGAGAPEIKPSGAEREAMEDAFRDWLGTHWHNIEDGGTGDVAQLLLALKAASPNFCDSAD